jgi:hypothetical protein
MDLFMRYIKKGIYTYVQYTINKINGVNDIMKEQVISELKVLHILVH